MLAMAGDGGAEVLPARGAATSSRGAGARVAQPLTTVVVIDKAIKNNCL